MENKINVAEILKDCPKGMELDCTMYENVEFDYVEQNSELTYPIHCLMKINGGYNALVFTRNGCNDRHPNAKCVIFPKGKTTWEGFAPPCEFKDGDIVISAFGDIHLLSTEDSSYCSYRERWRGLPKFDETMTTGIKVDRHATEEEKQELFDAIKSNGYKWNEETKTLEKLVEPKFKVGDRVQNKNTNMIGTINLIINDEREYQVALKNGGITYILFEFQDSWELVPNKFDINTLKPFESRVLVRDYDHQCWRVSFFGYFDKFMGKFDTVRGVYIQCIPYEGNEHLLGTTNNCDEFYKSW